MERRSVTVMKDSFVVLAFLFVTLVVPQLISDWAK